MQTLKAQRIPILVILTLALAMITVAIHSKPVHAQTTTTPAYTISAAADSSGVVILDQKNGKITFCTSLVNISGTTATPSGQCALLGTLAPTAGATASLSASSTASSLFVMNNVSGAVLECAVLQNLTGAGSVPEGSCVSRGTAN